MRLKIAAVLMILLCLLTACGSKETDALQAPMKFRTQLLDAGGCTFSAAVTADYGDSVQQFTLLCDCRTDGTASMEITAPETVAGIRADIEKSGGKLTFEDTAVGFGTLADGNVAPIAAPSLLVSAWTEAYISAAGSEGTQLRVTYEKGYNEEQLFVDCWFDEKNIPICAEICYNDKTVLKMELTDFSFVRGGNYETTEENLG